MLAEVVAMVRYVDTVMVVVVAVEVVTTSTTTTVVAVRYPAKSVVRQTIMHSIVIKDLMLAIMVKRSRPMQ
jgi:hypothetical protein